MTIDFIIQKPNFIWKQNRGRIEIFYVFSLQQFWVFAFNKGSSDPVCGCSYCVWPSWNHYWFVSVSTWGLNSDRGSHICSPWKSLATPWGLFKGRFGSFSHSVRTLTRLPPYSQMESPRVLKHQSWLGAVLNCAKIRAAVVSCCRYVPWIH